MPGASCNARRDPLATTCKSPRMGTPIQALLRAPTKHLVTLWAIVRFEVAA